MHDRRGLICVLTVCAVLLAACAGGGGSGTGSATPGDPVPGDPAPGDPAPANPTPANPTPANPTPANPTPTDATPTDPAPTSNYGSYGEWNQQVRDAILEVSNCLPGVDCDPRLPAAPGTIVSPFGPTAAYDGANDNWVAQWTGSVSGYKHVAPNDDGPLTRNWAGDAFLEIRAADRANVVFWTEHARYLTMDGQPGGFGPDRLSDAATPMEERWRAPLADSYALDGDSWNT